jgi:hypothetical protein
MDENGPRNHRRRCDSVFLLDYDLHAIARQYLDGRTLGRSGKRVRVLAHEKRAFDFLGAAVFANRLSNRQDVRLRERFAQ